MQRIDAVGNRDGAKRYCNAALHKYINGMAMDLQRVEAIEHIIRNRMAESGVDNYRFAGGELKIGAMRYAVEPCGCGEAGCDGVHLRPVDATCRH